MASSAGSDAGASSTLLIEAADAGSVEDVSKLLNTGAFVDVQDGGGQSALHYACSKGHADVVRTLLSRGANPDIANRNQATPLHTACIKGQRECITALIDAGASTGARAGNGATPLHATCLEGHADCTQLMLQAGADCNSTDDGGSTPLHCACMLGFASCVELLVDAGASVNAQDSNGSTPLHSACSIGNAECTALLLAGGADVRVQNDKGKTPLSLAQTGGHSQLLKMLTLPQVRVSTESPQNVRSPDLVSGSVENPLPSPQDKEADRMVARFGGIRGNAESATSSLQTESDALKVLREQIDTEALRLEQLRSEVGLSGGKGEISPSGRRSMGTEMARNQLTAARVARDGLRKQLEGAQLRLKTLQGDGNHRLKVDMARQRQREHSGISPRSTSNRLSIVAVGDVGDDVLTIMDEARRLRARNIELERQLNRHEERRFTLQRIANEQSFARKRLKEIRGELSLLNAAISLRREEVEAAREVMGPSQTQQLYAKRIEAIAVEVKRWKGSQADAERESSRLHSQLVKTKQALSPFLSAKKIPPSTPGPSDAKAVRTMGEAIAGFVVRWGAEAKRYAELAKQRSYRTVILEEAVNEAAQRFRELLSQRRAETMGIEPSEAGTPRELRKLSPSGDGWLPLSNSLSLEEMQGWLTNVIEADEAYANDIFKANDEEGAGNLDRKSFLHSMLLLGMSPYGVKQDAMGRLFDLLDRHKMGRVSHAQMLWLLKGGAFEPTDLLSPRELRERREELSYRRNVVLAQAVVRRHLVKMRIERAERGTIGLQTLFRTRLAKRNLALRKAVAAARSGGDVFTLTQTTEDFGQVTWAGDNIQERTTVQRAGAADSLRHSQGKASRLSKIELKEETGDKCAAIEADVSPKKPKSSMCIVL
mmetsp:Transcript_20216/g.56963  ORF Transcript_20216/g.56963 Transcript_20216/m.56963 type:complete len:885 (+) Transcript_20216:130-2784(+)